MAGAGDIVVTGARLYDGTGTDPIPDAMLVVREGRVAYAGPRADAPQVGDAPIVDAEGRALTPGLIDAHVHLCFDGEADFEAEARVDPGRAALKAARNAMRALSAGITTVRDLGGIGAASLDIAWAQREGVIQGPRILTAGTLITITGGHSHFIGLEVDGPHEMVKAVRRIKKAGADLIKIVATGGVLTPGIGAQRSAFSADEVAAGVNEAREAGMRVAAHAIGSEGIVAALQGGVTSIEHGCFLTDEAFKLMVENPSWLVATLAAPHQICFGGAGVPEFAVAKSKEVMASHADSFRRAYEAGVRIASGTDAGTPYNRHGGLPLELRLMHQAGMPLERVLAAATSEAAALLGLDDVGTLTPGAIADFILIDGDPYADVGAYEQVALVAQGGRVSVGRLS